MWSIAISAPAPLPTNRLSPHGRSRGRDRVVRCVARKRGETMVEHELRLVEFFLYIMRLEAQRLREDLLTTLARQGRQPAHTLATGLREALTDMLPPPGGRDSGKRSCICVALASGFAGHLAKRV